MVTADRLEIHEGSSLSRQFTNFVELNILVVVRTFISKCDDLKTSLAGIIYNHVYGFRYSLGYRFYLALFVIAGHIPATTGVLLELANVIRN